ncbi:ATP-dependent zinc metalloprotease FtsH [candidate division WWE3 bacterium]|nr:ATP-dependent zinc metalloprotease FtsH [candidate division WWE3 bacterium]MBT7350228.1 ATP-dependent zinc metalloprotease FtsH [candidate division WWE3 bacterium]
MARKPSKKTKKKKVVSKKTAQKPLKPRSIFQNVFFYVFIIVFLYLVVGPYFEEQLESETRPISDVITLIQEEQVQNITVSRNKIDIQLRDGSSFMSEKEETISFDQILANSSIDRSKISGQIEIKRELELMEILAPILYMGFPILILLFVLKQMKGAGGDIMSFGQSRARLFNKEIEKVTFKDVAGIEEAKTELYEIVDFLKKPGKYRKLGARIPKGVLLVGPAGVGKTLLAKAIAGEADVPFFSVAGSEFMEMLVGVGSARARDLFKKARESQPSLIFIDEIDAIGRQRGMGIGGGHDEREQTLNQILIEMDGFDPRTNVIVIAATNRPDMLDPALVRPGRFDRKIAIPLPDLKGREEILQIHVRGKPLDEEIDLKKIAKRTVGFTGADLENMMNEAAIHAARAGRKKVTEDDVEEAALKVTMGTERKTFQTEMERKVTAYHEAGHALVASKMPSMDPVHQISIIARGDSLGHTSFPPERDRYNETKTRLLSLITTMLGGRAAEEIEFKEMTIGASDDIKRATSLARRMVTEFGMSDLGPINYNGHAEHGWLAREMNTSRSYSEDMATRIDGEITKIMDNAYKLALGVLKKNKTVLDKVATALLDHETIRGPEYEKLLA